MAAQCYILGLKFNRSGGRRQEAGGRRQKNECNYILTFF